MPAVEDTALAVKFFHVSAKKLGRRPLPCTFGIPPPLRFIIPIHTFLFAGLSEMIRPRGFSSRFYPKSLPLTLDYSLHI